MKKRHYMKAFLVAFCLCIAITAVFPKVVYASYDSWVEDTDGYNEVYGNGTQFDTVDGEPADEDVKEEASFFEWYIAGFFRHCATGLWWLEKNAHMDMDRVILGRVHRDVRNNLYGFDLSNGNIYGTISSIIYAMLRNFVFGIFGVYFVVMLFEYLIKGTGARRANMKELVENFVFSFLLLYAMPILVDILIFTRDSLIYAIQAFLNSELGTSGISIVDIFFQESKDTGLISYSLLYLVSAGAGIYLAVNYIKIALQEAYLFAAFPFVALKGLRDKSIMGKWSGQFITNLAVPLIDCAGLGMIIMAGEIFGGPDAGVGQAFVRLMMFCLLVPSRNIILQLFGAPVPARGMSFLPFMFMAARMAMMRSRAGVPEAGDGKNVPIENNGPGANGANNTSGSGSTISAPSSVNGSMDSIDNTEDTTGGIRGVEGDSAAESNMESFNDTVSDNTAEMEKLSGNGGMETMDASFDGMEDMESISGPVDGSMDDMDQSVYQGTEISREGETISAPASEEMESIQETMPDGRYEIQSVENGGIENPANTDITDMETTNPVSSDSGGVYYADSAEISEQSVSGEVESKNEWSTSTGQGIHSTSEYVSDMGVPVTDAASVQGGRVSAGEINEIRTNSGKMETRVGTDNHDIGRQTLVNSASVETVSGKTSSGELKHMDASSGPQMEKMPAHDIEEKTVSGTIHDPVNELRQKEIFKAKQTALETDKKYRSISNNNQADYDAEKHNVVRQQQLKAAAKNVAKVTASVGKTVAVAAGTTTAVGLTAISGNPSTMAIAALGGGLAVKGGVSAVGDIGKKKAAKGGSSVNAPDRKGEKTSNNKSDNKVSGQKDRHTNRKERARQQSNGKDSRDRNDREHKVQKNRKEQAADATATLDNMFGKDE